MLKPNLEQLRKRLINIFETCDASDLSQKDGYPIINKILTLFEEEEMKAKGGIDMNDLLPYKHGDEGEGSTHSACPEMVEKYGDKVGCCVCHGHKCKDYPQASEGWLFPLYKPKNVQILNSPVIQEIIRLIKEELRMEKKELMTDKSLPQGYNAWDKGYNEAVNDFNTLKTRLIKKLEEMV